MNTTRQYALSGKFFQRIFHSALFRIDSAVIRTGVDRRAIKIERESYQVLRCRKFCARRLQTIAGRVTPSVIAKAMTDGVTRATTLIVKGIIPETFTLSANEVVAADIIINEVGWGTLRRKYDSRFQ